MTNNIALAITENMDVLLAYLDELKLFLEDSAGTTIPPEFRTFVEGIDLESLELYALTRTTAPGTYAESAIVDTIQTLKVLQRDFKIRNMSRADYYNNGLNVTKTEIVYVTQRRDDNTQYVVVATPLQTR